MSAKGFRNKGTFARRPGSACKRGHLVEGKNAYKRANGYLECRLCRDLANKRLHKRTKEAPVTMELIRRFAKIFWSRVKKSAGCWLWQGAPGSGYGSFRVAGHDIQPNRFSLALKLRRVPRGFACHTCDTPMCVRQKHLYEGTPASNMADRGARGRTARGERNGARSMPWRVPRGTRNGNAKLDEAKIRVIRALYATGGLRQVDIAKRFGITQVLVSCIVLRKIWKAVP